jgi:hypothetical protein
MTYDLYYWPGIQGRGEFVRLALEEAGARYGEVAVLPQSQGGGVPGILKVLEARDAGRPPFAPPILGAGRRASHRPATATPTRNRSPQPGSLMQADALAHST